MPHEKGFKTSFVVAAHRIDDVRRFQQRIEGLFGVRLHVVDTNASHADRWIEVYNAESQDICTKVTEYVRALCTPETESVHRCSAEAHRSIFEGGRRDTLEREYAVLIEELNSHQCTLRARGSELSVALVLSAIDDNVSSRGESAAPKHTPGLPSASDDVIRSQDLQKRGDSRSLTSGSEFPIHQQHQPPGAEPNNGIHSRMAANLSYSRPWDELEADYGAEMKILPPSRPKPTRHKGQFPAENFSGTEQGRSRITPTDFKAETVLAPARLHEDAAVGGASDGGGSSRHTGATTSGSSSGQGSAAMVRVASIGRSGTTGGSGDRVLPLSDLSEQRQDVSTSLINAAIAAGCDEVSIAVVLSQSEHDQPDRQWTPDEFVRAVQENGKQQIRNDRYSAGSTSADRNAVAASGSTSYAGANPTTADRNAVAASRSTSYAGANPTLAEAARRLPVMPKTNTTTAGYNTAPLLARPITATAAAGHGGSVQPVVPAARWDAGGSRSNNSGPLVGSGSAIQGSRHATYPPVRSPTVGSQPLFFLEVDETARLRDLPHNEKSSYSGSRLPLLAPPAFFVGGERGEMMQQPPQQHPFIPVVGASPGAAVQPVPLPPQKWHVPPSMLADRSQTALSESKSSPAVLFAEGKPGAEAISFAIEKGYDPAIVYEVATAQPGSTTRIADFLQAVRARAASAFAAGSATSAIGATAQVTKSQSAAPPSSRKGTDVLAFAKDYGYSEEEISAARLDIGDNPTPQELLAALKKRSETVRISSTPIAASSSGSKLEAIQFAIEQGFDPAIVYEVAAQHGSTVRATDLMQAVKARIAFATGSAAPAAGATAQVTKSRSAVPPSSKKGTDVLAFAKDYGYSEEEINAARLDIGDNPTPQELLAALKKRSEAVRVNATPTAVSSSGCNSDVTQLAKSFGNSAQDIGAAWQDRSENAAPRDTVAARRPSEASKAAPRLTAKVPPVRSNSDVFAFAEDYGYSKEEISAARLDIGDNPTPQELLAALKKRSETSQVAAISTATAALLRPQGPADVDWPLPSRRWVPETEPTGGGIRGSPLKQVKGGGAAVAVGSRKNAAAADGGGTAGGRTTQWWTNASAARDQMPAASAAQSSNKRRIVIDGSNVAMFKGDGVFRCRNIQICVDYFLEKGHTDITVVVPQHRRGDSATADAYILEDLQKKNLLVYQPSKKLPNMPSIRPYDDKLILDIAANYDGVVISNDNYRDLLNDTPKRDFIIRNRVIMFTIIGDDMFYINDDPMGKGGPSLEQLLTAT